MNATELERDAYLLPRVAALSSWLTCWLTTPALMAEHHVDRRELNRRARERLVADGSLHAPELTVSGRSFHVGDEVVARVADRELRAEGAPRDPYVRNGSIGTVVHVRDDALVVCFERWGEVAVPRSYLERSVVGGPDGALQHAYALDRVPLS